MSSEIAIKVEKLSKCYQIYNQPHDRLKQAILPRLQKLSGRQPQQYFREFWALKNISFEIKKGETVGIVGRNGSGKSTLLQLICGTLNPSSGRIQTRGRIAALLELGSGFNPEFTGRENVYMNAALLGLSKEETDARFDDIIAFADIGDFIEQPVKTYSSGMMVRLAFAVIVHVDADILVVDEALAVGDAFFTQKCMMHIKKLQQSGVTLLFVSHDTGAVKSLCSSAIMLEHGEKVCEGETGRVVDAYYGKGIQQQQDLMVSGESNSNELKAEITKYEELNLELSEKFQRRAIFQRLQNGQAEFLNVQLLDEMGNEIELVDYGQHVTLRMVFRANENMHMVGVAYHVRNKNGFDVGYSDTNIENCPLISAKAKEIFILDWRFKVALQEGEYTISAMISIPVDLSIGQVKVCDFVPIAAQVKVMRGKSLPIYGAVHWNNEVSINKCSEHAELKCELSER